MRINKNNGVMIKWLNINYIINQIIFSENPDGHLICIDNFNIKFTCAILSRKKHSRGRSIILQILLSLITISTYFLGSIALAG